MILGMTKLELAWYSFGAACLGTLWVFGWVATP